MTLAKLMEMGLSEEKAKEVMALLDGNYVTKTRFNEINEENKNLKKTVSERDTQLETLKKSSGDNEELKKQISDLQKTNADQKSLHEKELRQLKLDNAVDIALSDAKAKNSKAVRAMLDLEKVSLGDDGKLSGLSEQLEALKTSDAYMFDAQQQQQFKGFQPGASSTVPDAKTTAYEARLADARKNNNQLEVIQIKQEAAAEGVILM